MKKVRVGALGSSWVDEDEPGKVAGELERARKFVSNIIKSMGTRLWFLAGE